MAPRAYAIAMLFSASGNHFAINMDAHGMKKPWLTPILKFRKKIREKFLYLFILIIL
jgi:hypothetical protein